MVQVKNMRIALSIVIVIHGIIHLFGFLKAFGFSEFNAISQPISKTFGILWLIAFLLFAVTLSLYLSYYPYWWIIAIFAVILSQFLIISYWSDSKFGTIFNLVILIAALIGFSTISFQKKVNTEVSNLFAESKKSEKIILTEQMLKSFPHPVKKWLCNSGIPGNEIIQHVYLEQEIQMLMKPEQKDWMKAEAKQYFSVEPPAFNWTIDLHMKPGLKVVGRDKFEDGKGEMLIKLLSAIPMVNAKDSEKVDQATLQRYLAEIVWFPSAAISSYISWEPIDDYSANAIMNYKGTEGSGVFHFDENGDFKKFVAMRYKDARDAEPAEWTVTASETAVRNGIRIPVQSEVKWKLEDSEWTWLKLRISDIKYNDQYLASKRN